MHALVLGRDDACFWATHDQFVLGLFSSLISHTMRAAVAVMLLALSLSRSGRSPQTST